VGVIGGVAGDALEELQVLWCERKTR
jgi:hypothetical protein